MATKASDRLRALINICGSDDKIRVPQYSFTGCVSNHPICIPSASSLPRRPRSQSQQAQIPVFQAQKYSAINVCAGGECPGSAGDYAPTHRDDAGVSAVRPTGQSARVRVHDARRESGDARAPSVRADARAYAAPSDAAKHRAP